MLPSLNKTRQEVLSNILGRIPQAFITGEEIVFRQTIGLTIVDEFTPATMMATSRQEEVAAHTGSGAILQKMGQDTTLARGKRRKAKYSFAGRMLKKHPVLKFSATGPLDKDKSPLKWWSRVCRVELSLMKRGSLELISNYSPGCHFLTKTNQNYWELPCRRQRRKQRKPIKFLPYLILTDHLWVKSLYRTSALLPAPLIRYFLRSTYFRSV